MILQHRELSQGSMGNSLLFIAVWVCGKMVNKMNEKHCRQENIFHCCCFKPGWQWKCYEYFSDESIFMAVTLDRFCGNYWKKNNRIKTEFHKSHVIKDKIGSK